VRLSLIVLSPGRWQGREIPVGRFPFLVGRDPACHLRPATNLVSHRHCAITVRGQRAFVQDLRSTNGTFIDGAPAVGEHELPDGVRLDIGPLTFQVRIQQLRVPPPQPLAAPEEEDAAASFFLEASETSGADQKGSTSDGAEATDANATVADLAMGETWGPNKTPQAPAATASEGKKPEDTSAAAKAILNRLRKART
jgi:predicted component of type VI protein secretion system